MEENIKSTAKKNQLMSAALYIAPIVILYIQTVFLFGLITAPSQNKLLNLLLFLPLYGLVYAAFKGVVPAYITVSVLQLGLYYINEFVGSIRQSCIQFTDIYCINEALAVAGNYRPAINRDIVLSFAAVFLFCLLIFILFRRRRDSKVHSLRLYGLITAAAACGYIMMIYPNNVTLPPPGYYINELTRLKGLPLALLTEFKHSSVSAPDGFSNDAAETVYNSYQSDTQAANAPEDTDIIVIMNEGFADFSLVGEPLYEDDPLDYIHSLDKNCAKGKLLVSVFGGSTCNTEFEFLTGSTMAFMPSGTHPYMQFMNEDVFSICKDECLENYTKTAIHPYRKREWRRNENYPMLGFDEFISGEDFSADYDPDKVDYTKQATFFGDDLEYYRGLISDRECFKKILSVLDKADAPSFIFAVTMQNHGDYLYPGFKADEYIRASEAKVPVNQYLTLISYSDDAFEYLLTKLSERERKTIVLMFGDHQPYLEDQTDEAVKAGRECFGYNRYIVPYIMWTNYDAELDMPDITSANYLGLHLKANLGMPLTPWDNIRMEAMETYPVLSAAGAVSSEGYGVNTETAVNDEALRDYYYVQYDMMFG